MLPSNRPSELRIRRGSSTAMVLGARDRTTAWSFRTAEVFPLPRYPWSMTAVLRPA
ncbi:MAG: hypothetical protein L3K19_04305 [Thermoplasmata archaeon]|nr:hypothetical protein [Thermoplasmata archaeon]